MPISSIDGCTEAYWSEVFEIVSDECEVIRRHGVSGQNHAAHWCPAKAGPGSRKEQKRAQRLTPHLSWRLWRMPRDVCRHRARIGGSASPILQASNPRSVGSGYNRPDSPSSTSASLLAENTPLLWNALLTMRTQPRVGYRFDQRRHILSWVARGFDERKMLNRHIRLQRAQDEFEDEPHGAVSKLHV